MQVRFEGGADRIAIHQVNSLAFGRAGEADLVDGLRSSTSDLLSLVAEDEGEIVAHILFSPVALEGHPSLVLMGLGPVAVIPRMQRRGLGSALILAGLEQCRGRDCGAVFVLGDPEYYSRFGFRAAREFDIRSQFGDCGDSFMALELSPGYLTGVSGVIRYHPLFASV